MQTPVISVIVPIYGVERWLPACVDSLLAQTFADFELILVDDGSPDGCPALCDAYARQDARVRVLHRPNGGLSAARNSGMELARGEYLAFVDSDDLVAPTYLQALYEAIRRAGADLAVCAAEDVQEDGSPFPDPSLTLPSEDGVFDGPWLLGRFFGENSTYYTVAWNKLYKASLWADLRYPEGMIHEDDAVAHLLYDRCGKVVCLSQPLYFYRMRQGSICHTALRPGSFDGVSAHAAWCRYFAQVKNDQALLDKALAGCWLRYLALCSQARTAPLSWPLCARWQAVRAEMLHLLPWLEGCTSLTAAQKLSCRRWAHHPVPLPPKGDKKRVALLLPAGLPVPAIHGGAVETLAQHLLEQNQKHKQLELVILCQWDGDAAALSGRWPETMFYYQSSPGRSPLHSLRYRLAGALGRPIHWDPWYAAPLAFLKQLDADLYIGEGGDLTGWQEASRVLGRERFAAHLHGATPGSEVLDAIYSRAFAISRYVGDVWQQGRADRPVTLIPNCVDGELFCPGGEAEARQAAALRAELGYSPEDFVVLYCGRTCPEKGIHQLVAALEQLPDPHIKALLVGSPFFGVQSSSPYFEDLQRRAAALGDRVQFTGFVHNTRLPAYYRMADAACFPALWEEPAGITAIEAMACGCPILATRSGGMPEYLEGSGAVLIQRSEIFADDHLQPVPEVPPMAGALAQALTALQGDPARRAQMAQAGPRAAARYTAPCYYQNTLDALSGACPDRAQ